MKRKPVGVLIVLGVLVALVATGGGIWWFWQQGQGTGDQTLQYTVVLETNVTPKEAEGTPLYRVVLHITTGTGFEVVQRYLNATQTQGAVYELLTTDGRFVAVSSVFRGEIDEIASPLKQAMAPWTNLEKVGTSGSYTVYRGELKPNQP